MEEIRKHPVKKAHFVGTSVVLTIDPMHLRRLAIDEFTFFVEKPAENGILLEMRRLEVAENKDPRN
jgi:hypothetical protein